MTTTQASSVIDARRKFRSISKPAPAKRRAQQLAWELIDHLTARRLTRKSEALVDSLAEFAMGRAAR